MNIDLSDTNDQMPAWSAGRFLVHKPLKKSLSVEIWLQYWIAALRWGEIVLKQISFYFRFFCLSDQIYIRKNITYEPWSPKEKIEKKNWPYTSIKSNTYFAIFNNYYLKNDFITRTGFRCSSKIGLKEFVPFFYLIIQLWPRKSEKTKKVYGTKLIVR